MTVHKISGHVNSHEQELKSGKHVDQCTRASLQPNTYEEVSTASMSHTGENDSGNSTPTKRCSKQVNVETSSKGQRSTSVDNGYIVMMKMTRLANEMNGHDEMT